MKNFAQRLRAIDPHLRTRRLPNGQHRVERVLGNGQRQRLCEAATLGQHVLDAVRAGDGRKNPDLWRNFRRQQAAHQAALDRDAAREDAAGKAALADAVRFDLCVRPTVGSTAAFRRGFDQIRFHVRQPQGVTA